MEGTDANLFTFDGTSRQVSTKVPRMNDSIEARLEALGLALAATEGESYYGAAYGTMKPFHITGSVLHLSGHVPIRNGAPLHPGRLGETVSIEQGIETAQWTAMGSVANLSRNGELSAMAGERCRHVNDFKGRHFGGEIVLWAVKWYCRYAISYRDLESMMAERGVAVDHSTIYRWVQRYAPEMEKRLRWQWRCPRSSSWRVDETYVTGRPAPRGGDRTPESGAEPRGPAHDPRAPLSQAHAVRRTARWRASSARESSDAPLANREMHRRTDSRKSPAFHEFPIAGGRQSHQESAPRQRRWPPVALRSRAQETPT